MTDVMCSFIIISTDGPLLGGGGRGMIKQTDVLIREGGRGRGMIKQAHALLTGKGGGVIN